jgi:hypothetical protein
VFELAVVAYGNQGEVITEGTADREQNSHAHRRTSISERIGMVSIMALAAFGIGVRSVHADGSCNPVHGTINSVFSSQNCTSPVGLCTVGTITGAGALDGTTTFTALGVAPSAGLPTVELAANLSYSGQLTIVTADGTLVTRDLGVLDARSSGWGEHAV